MHSRIVLLLSALAWGAVAQQLSVYNYTIDLGQVDLTTRAEWCRGERSVCDSLCGAPATPPTKNECATSSLDYACTCQNGTAPGLEFYVNSLPTFLCQEAFKQCNAASVGNAAGQTACKNNIQSKCGTLDASTVGGGSSTSAAVTSGTAAATQSQTGGSTSSTSSSKGVAAPTHIPQFAGVAAAALLLGAAAL